MNNPFDPANAPVGIPAELWQGVFAHWRTPHVSEDFAAYRYRYEMRHMGNLSGKVQTVEIDANGYASITPGQWPVGPYKWFLHYVRLSDTARHLVATGRLRLLADASTTATDIRTHAEIMVAKIESLLEGRADADIQSYTIEGRQVAKMAPAELLKWRDHYKAEVAAADALAGGNGAGGGRNTVRVRFI